VDDGLGQVGSSVNRAKDHIGPEAQLEFPKLTLGMTADADTDALEHARRILQHHGQAEAAHQHQ